VGARSILAIALVTVVAFSARDLHADTPAPSAEQEPRAAAKREFVAGDAAYAKGDFTAAAGHFEAAYGLAPHPAALLNAAQAWEAAKNYARAANLYAKYLREAPSDAAPRTTASSSLKNLAPKVAELDITANGLTDLAVDDHPTEGAVVYVEPGHHYAYGRKGDRIARIDIDVAAGSVTPVTLPPPTDLPAPTLTPEAAPTPTPTPTPTPPPTLTPPPPHHRLPPWVVYLGSGLTALGLAATIWSGAETAQFKSDVYDPAPTAANLTAGLMRERRTNILLGVTVGVAATTGAFALWLVDWHRKDGSRVGLGVLPSEVALRSSF
jgi:hypothetical protein